MIKVFVIITVITVTSLPICAVCIALKLISTEIAPLCTYPKLTFVHINQRKRSISKVNRNMANAHSFAQLHHNFIGIQQKFYRLNAFVFLFLILLFFEWMFPMKLFDKFVFQLKMKRTFVWVWDSVHVSQ